MLLQVQNPLRTNLPVIHPFGPAVLAWAILPASGRASSSCEGLHVLIQTVLMGLFGQQPPNALKRVEAPPNN